MKFQGAVCKITKKPTEVFTALFPECFDVQIHLIKTKTAKIDSWNAVRKSQRGKCTFCTRAGFLSSNGKFCAFEQDLVRTLHPPAEGSMARQHQPGQGADLSLHLQSLEHITKAQLPLSTGYGWIHDHYSCSTLSQEDGCVLQTIDFLGWNRVVCGHREVHYLQSPEWDSFGVWVMLQPPCNSGGCLAAAGEPRTTGSLSTSLHPPLLQRACFFPHLMNI